MVDDRDLGHFHAAVTHSYWSARGRGVRRPRPRLLRRAWPSDRPRGTEPPLPPLPRSGRDSDQDASHVAPQRGDSDAACRRQCPRRRWPARRRSRCRATDLQPPNRAPRRDRGAEDGERAHGRQVARLCPARAHVGPFTAFPCGPHTSFRSAAHPPTTPRSEVLRIFTAPASGPLRLPPERESPLSRAARDPHSCPRCRAPSLCPKG
jgi:hypothetical protein